MVGCCGYRPQLGGGLCGVQTGVCAEVQRLPLQRLRSNTPTAICKVCSSARRIILLESTGDNSEFDRKAFSDFQTAEP